MVQDGVAKRFIELTHATPEPSWQLILLSDLEPVNTLVRNVTAFTLVTLGLIGLLMLYLRQRQMAIRDGLAARNALQRANDELEHKVFERTQTLEQTNVQLVREVAERKHAEEVLREAQNELVHAVKMAALGQMSAGITHELNQPLAALRTLSDNASVLLQRGRHEDVAGNLTMISQLTERMGKITSQLKSFARKSELAIGPVSVQLALDNSLELLHQPIHKRGIQVNVSLSPGNVTVRADQSRIEQVFVNLLMNAIDAIPESVSGRIDILANEHADGVSIQIADNGPGIATDVLPRLFEPFVTSKPPGSGLGLGLTISTGIVTEFGGTLRAENRPQGGANFILELKSARTA
jgi:two-component system C4-dicarboxylate transport sensor histidine kinase DctB